MLTRRFTLRSSATISAIFSILRLFSITAAATEATADTLDVSFPSFDNFMLEGTFYLPLDSSGTSTAPTADHHPAPGVVLIHGSGPQSRDANLNSQVGMTFPTTIPAFVEIATSLQKLGIAVLTYDKRSCGTFNNCYNNSYPMPEEIDTIDVFLSDAQSALEYLQSREEVDSGRVVPVGHSQSGSYIPVLLRDGPEGIVGGVVLEGPLSPVDELIAYQLSYTLQLIEDLYGLNATEATNVPQVAGLVQFAEGTAAIRDGTSDEAVGGASASFWRSWFQLSDEARAAAAVVEQPLFILNGELDTNVPVKEAYAWEEYLVESGKTNFQVEILECVTHALNCLAESDVTKLDPATDIGTEVDPKVHNALADFVLSVTSVADGDEDDKDDNIGGDDEDPGSETTSSANFSMLRPQISVFLLIGLLISP
jgi:pimeloyl-ACP methyl ester carboxylesterase